MRKTATFEQVSLTSIGHDRCRLDSKGKLMVSIADETTVMLGRVEANGGELFATSVELRTPGNEVPTLALVRESIEEVAERLGL